MTDGADFPYTLTEDGMTYHLINKAVIQDAEGSPVTGYTDYSYPVDSTSVPQTKEVSITSTVTGQPTMVTCQLTGVTILPDTAWTDTNIDIQFVSYDADLFVWGNIEVQKNDSIPLLPEHEATLLASVGAGTEEYQVTDIRWSSEPYQDADGTWLRDAVADVQRKLQFYRATYAGSLQEGKRYELTYEAVQEVPTGKATYTIQAEASYTLVEQPTQAPAPVQNKMTVVQKILTTVAIVLLAVVVVLVLWLLAEKKKVRGKDGSGNIDHMLGHTSKRNKKMRR
ncbi:MAG: hypothetical protein ACK5MN_00410 [Lachnospiraceae bacterium]